MGFDKFDDGDTEGANVNITDPNMPSRKAGVTDDGRVQVQTIPNKISTLNSTTIPLSEDGIFTGDWEDCSIYTTLTIMVSADAVSAVNGWKIQWSSDGVNLDHEKVFSFEKFTSGQHVTLGILTKYFRVIFVNGNSAQSSFRLQTILYFNQVKNPSHAIEAMIHDTDAAEITKAVITGKSSVSGNYKNVATDDDGRLLISGQSALISPLPSIKVVERRVLAASQVYAFTTNITQDTAIKEFTFGGRGPGEGMFGRYLAADTEQVPGGDFESSGEVSLWLASGVGDSSAVSPTYSTTQAFTGTGSAQMVFTKSDHNNYAEMTHTFSTPKNLDQWRYVESRFYNDPPAGGTTTRTISVILTDSLGNKRFYSISGQSNVAPMNVAGWIQILREISIPTSQIGTTFDINNVVSISLRIQDANNKAGTIYWDSVKFIGTLDIIQKIYTNGNTIPLQFDPVVIFDAGEVMYLALRNNDTTAKEFQLTVAGVDIT
jgi:hypothetical protein